MDEFGASHGEWSCSSCSRGPAESIRTPVMEPGKAVWALVCATFVRDGQAMLPEPHDKPTPEPGDDLEDDPENEPKDQPDDELEDDPRDEPDTLYFGREDGARPILLKPTSRPGCEAAIGEGAASVSWGAL